jgi:GH25 family lysozyme M1 (1,4-beta-N-acetylmuramidase)/Cdc6-like AAA superfamily ATPase
MPVGYKLRFPAFEKAQFVTALGIKGVSMAQAPQANKTAPRRKSTPARVTNLAEQAVSEPPPSVPGRASGVDVSQYQQTVDWQRAAAEGQSFAFIKATHGEKNADPMFIANWMGAKEVGLLRGAYHVFDPIADPESQAEFFIKTVLSTSDKNDMGELPSVLDIEPVDPSMAGELVPRVKAWLDRVESALGRKPILYSNLRTLQNNFVDTDGAFPSWAGQHPLWIAEYSTPDGQPTLPIGWSNWAFWQYSDQGQVGGIQGKTDLNVFNGSLEELRRFASGASEAGKLRLNFALNDRPQGPDRLDYEKYADAFAQVLSGQYTQTPLTVGIYASWGMGKSFLLGKIREKLKAVNARDEQLDFAFIEFNAWVYSGSENLWAGLVTTLYDGIEQHYKSSGGDRLVQDYRRQEALKQLWRTFKKSLMLALAFGVPAFTISVLLDYQSIQEDWKFVANAFLLILGGSPLLSKLPDLLKGIKSLIDSVVLLRSQELAKLSSRKDFREQVGFMAEIQAELRHISDLIKALDERKKRKTRFIIFVDDLDRCPPDKAVEVLEAIMLLLSDRTEDPFVIFLAMDARVLVKAVEMRYGEVLKDSGVSGYEFLDKIVQIPFRIPPASDGAIKKYVKSLLYQSHEAHEMAEQAAQELPATDTSKTTDEGAGDETQREEKPLRTPPKPDPQKEAESSAETAPPEEEPFKPEEQQAFETFSKFLSRNPRRVKRIVNIYRMSRILSSTDVLPQTAIKWAILTEQWPFRIAWVMQKIEDDLQLEKGISMDWALPDVYDYVHAFVQDERSRHLALLDEDAEIFEAFIMAAPVITVGDIHKLWSVTFNLNPAMQNEVLKSALQNGMRGRAEMTA